MMKVIYKTSMVDKIIAEIYEAKSINKEIEKIVLSPDVWEDLEKELQLFCSYTILYYANETFTRGGPVAIFKGILIIVE